MVRPSMSAIRHDIFDAHSPGGVKRDGRTALVCRRYLESRSETSRRRLHLGIITYHCCQFKFIYGRPQKSNRLCLNVTQFFVIYWAIVNAEAAIVLWRATIVYRVIRAGFLRVFQYKLKYLPESLIMSPPIIVGDVRSLVQHHIH